MGTLLHGEYRFNENDYKPIGNLSKADFVLYDGEGVIGEAYFFKISKRNHRPQALKIIACLTALDESAFDNHTIKRAMTEQKELCDKCTAYPMRFLRESDLRAMLDKYRYEKHTPFVYKGCGARLYYGDDSSDIRFTYVDDMHDNERTLTTLAWATALELMARSGEISELDYPDFLP